MKKLGQGFILPVIRSTAVLAYRRHTDAVQFTNSITIKVILLMNPFEVIDSMISHIRVTFIVHFR